MSDEEGEKSEKPSSRRLNEASGEGQVPISRDVPQWLGMCMGTVALFALGGALQESFVNMLRGSAIMLSDPDPNRLWPLISPPIKLVVGFCGLSTLAVVLGFVVQTGGRFWPNMLWKGFDDLLSARSLTNMFSKKMALDLCVSLLKTAFVVWVFWRSVRADFLSLPAISLAPAGEQFSLMFRPLAHAAVKVLASMLLLVGLDLALTKYRYLKGLKMSKEDLKREAKDDEGDPKLKGKRKAKHRELSRGRAAIEVPKADALIVNPTHIAIAIRYEPGKHRAPVVTAKGKGELAEYMRELARSNGIPIYQDIPLARLLFKKVKVGRAVPSEAYKAVAAVLAFVYRVTRRRSPVSTVSREARP